MLLIEKLVKLTAGEDTVQGKAQSQYYLRRAHQAFKLVFNQFFILFSFS
jgi:hypothetical protein